MVRDKGHSLPTPLVIGISGASRSGKSTLSAQLVDHFGGNKTVTLHQDSFASHSLAARHKSGWEATESIDHAKLRKELAKHANAKTIIIEGIRAFHDPELVAAMHVLVWIDVSREVCRERKTSVSADAFDEHVWPRHAEYRDYCFSSAGPLGQSTTSSNCRARLVLNGKKPTAALLQQVIAAIEGGSSKAVKPIVKPKASAAAVQPSARAASRSRDAQAGKAGARGERAKQGQETLSIIETGGYLDPTSGEWVDASEAIAACVARSEFVPASATLSAAAGPSKPLCGRLRVEVADEGTMTAAKRLVNRGHNVVALNFASFRNPGGGWLTGAQAQEESLARSSALVAALTAPGPCADHYAANQSARGGERNPLYAHDMIYSPAVPVFRDDDGGLLPQPWPLAFISAAAPNAGEAMKNHAVSAGTVEAVYMERAERVLAVAHRNGHDAIVLGAWGCGVFKNDTKMAANVFKRLLNGRFKGCFRVAAFPVLGMDANPNEYAAFRALASEGGGVELVAAAAAEEEEEVVVAEPVVARIISGSSLDDLPPPEPPMPSRNLSEAYGRGASKYDEAVLIEWKEHGLQAADAAKKKKWRIAREEFATCAPEARLGEGA